MNLELMARLQRKIDSLEEAHIMWENKRDEDALDWIRRITE
jgi:hypothetical protein